MTQYLLAVHGSEEDMAAVPAEQMQIAFAQVDELNAELQAKGVWVFAGGLQPASTATVVKVDNGETIMTDGPYLETKEQIGGFWIIEAADLDAAIEWARRASIACMNPVEVRPFQGLPED
jgi:hypothetical protein